MLYKKNAEKSLSDELFRNPTCEYRGTPFWAWNCKLEWEELERQIDIFRQMGFGGFHMHVRTGMDTPYLGEEYMKLVHNCVNKAKKSKMLAWLYDEDRWPSGAAGGIVTKDEKYRQRYLLFTPKPYDNEGSSSQCLNSSAAAAHSGKGKLLACFDIVLNAEKELQEYRILNDGELAHGTIWYAYLETPAPSPWYNNQTYVNTIDKKAIDRFIEVTYESYQKSVGEEFGKIIPAIFTDEPQFTRKNTLQFADGYMDVTLPWADDLEDTFHDTYQTSLIAHIPELIWELPDRKISQVRYYYHDHVAQRFTEAFADNCGKWCKEHGIMLTGHMMDEPTLFSQTKALGEAMRSYRSFQLPGIDMLADRIEHTTAKQAQSAAHQYGAEGVLSELYGVTGWDFDFRGHKLYGDWQAALGVTVRVPHLAWVSMAGEAKRDYPASINYQSPWYTEYSYVENHFARVSTAMTRGTPIVRIGVIHPVESYWLHWGPAEQTALVRNQMDENFKNVTHWLLRGAIDFDFISESLFPELCPEAGAPLQVGKMAYDAIVVPECETLRSTTLERLETFRDAGGTLIFMGSKPSLENAMPSDRGAKLYDRSISISFSNGALLNALKEYRMIDLRNGDGSLTTNLLYQLRQDGQDRWLFIAHDGTNPYNKDVSTRQTLQIRVVGKFRVELYNTLDGSHGPVSVQHRGNETIIDTAIYDYDSLLYRLIPSEKEETISVPEAVNGKSEHIRLAPEVSYELSEPNAYILDIAEFAIDNEPYEPEEEILRAENICRNKLGLRPRGGHVVQPYILEKQPAKHQMRMRFTIESAIDYTSPLLALENAELSRIIWNNQEVAPVPNGWYVDKAIRTVPLPELKQGINILEIIQPLGKRTNAEWCYLLGNFGVELRGRCKKIIPLPKTLAFDSIVHQGLPFYSGCVSYQIETITSGGACALHLPHYRAGVMKVFLDGKDMGHVAYPPYNCDLGTPEAGKHRLTVKLFLSRNNGFSPLHLADTKREYQDPNTWRVTGDKWSYEYHPFPEGLLSTPILTETK